MCVFTRLPIVGQTTIDRQRIKTIMDVNTQPREQILVARDKDGHPEDGTLDVISIWKTIQGEGPFAGTPAIFIRLAGCNLQCPWCDTEYTTGRKPLPASEIAFVAMDKMGAAAVRCRNQGGPKPLAVITGGEPLRQDLRPLLRHLLQTGFRVQIETNGTVWRDELPWGTFTVVCSPKAAVHRKLMPHIDALKYVVQEGFIDPTDGLPLATLGNKHTVSRPSNWFMGQIFVQPLDEQDESANQRNLKMAVEVCLEFGYQLCLQQHKTLGLL